MARDAATLTAEIAQLQRLRSSGASSVTTDGVTTTFRSDAEIRNRIGELQQELAGVQGGTPSTKPRIRGINLGSAW
jgi:hypothetical protein